jgi:hypothetical protein
LKLQKENEDLLAKNAELASRPNPADSKVLIEPQTHTRRASVVSTKSSWESDKIQQKKMELLKEKLKVKTTEHETLENSYHLLKDCHSKSERDRLRLQTKLNQLMTEPIPVVTNTQAESIAELEKKVKILQSALAKSLKKSKLSVADTIVPLLPSKITPTAPTEELKRELVIMGSKRQEDQAKLHKLGEENQKLKSKLKREVEKLKKIDELTIANEELVKEVLGLRKSVVKIDNQLLSTPDQELKDSKSAGTEKETIIQSLDSSEISRLSGENRRLKRELELAQIRLSKYLNSDYQRQPSV